jgi:amidohydrolase
LSDEVLVNAALFEPAAVPERIADALDAHIEAVAPEIVRVRRHLHAHPELGWQEFETQRFLHDWLEARGVRARRCANTGLICDLGPEDAPRVLYRGDIDALPIVEAKDHDVPYASQHAGVSHACGHDVHASVAAGVAWVMQQMQDDLPAGVRVIFQPAEEVVPSGAEAMIREGAAQGVRAALALHVDPTREVGPIGVRTGVLTSATDTFSIRVVGREGHSARPHLARDANLCAANLIQALYTLISQRVNPLVPAVLNVGTMRGGVAKNVISGECVLEGVVRTLDLEVRDKMHREMREVVEAIGQVHRCDARLVITTGAPPVVNHPSLDAIIRQTAATIVGEANVMPIEFPSTGAEDFGMFGLHMPQYMMRLGVRAPGAEVHHLHTGAFDIDERAVAIALRIMTRALWSTLQSEAL